MAAMRRGRVLRKVAGWSACVLLFGMSAIGQMRTITVPAGKTLESALKKQVLGQDGGQPFHVVLEIAEAKGTDAQYSATVEETWLAKDNWMRTVRAQGLEQTVIADGSGLHYETAGDYFPLWLHAFVIGMFSPVDVAQWTRGSETIDQKEFSNGGRTVLSEPCIHHEFMLGDQEKQVNFANLCFTDDRRLKMVQGPEFAVSFSDYERFGKLEVPRTLSVDAEGVQLVGRVKVLEAPAAGAHVAAVPADATAVDPLRWVVVSTAALEKLAGEQIAPTWPAQIPGSGQFTLWVAVDRTGKVRQVETRNTDLSGFAADMAKTLKGRQWKVPVAEGAPVQVEGALVYRYPPAQSAAMP